MGEFPCLPAKPQLSHLCYTTLPAAQQICNAGSRVVKHDFLHSGSDSVTNTTFIVDGRRSSWNQLHSEAHCCV